MISISSLRRFRLAFTLSRDYFLFASGIALTVIVLCIIITATIYNAHIKSLYRQLLLEGSYVEQVITDIFDETNDQMVYLGKQIAEHGSSDINYIVSLFKNISGAEYKSKTINTWTIFDWINPNHLLLVNSKVGRLKKPVNMSYRDYTGKCAQTPWKLQVSAPALGRMSGKWVIPMGVGITDPEGNYIGIVAGGFHISKLNEEIEALLSTSKISYLVLDNDAQIILRSPDNILGTHQSSLQENVSESLRDQLPTYRKKGELKEPFHHKTINYTHYYRMKDYPYIIITGFDHKVVNKRFYAQVFPRLIECIGVGAFCLILLYLFRRRIINPIVKLSQTAAQLSKGLTDIAIPRPNSREMFHLTKGLLQVVRYIKRTKSISNQLEYALNLAKASDEAREEFISRINKELSEPLNTILYYSDVLLKQAQGQISVPISVEKYTQLLRHINDAATNLRSLTTDILNLSFLNINSVIESCITIQSKQAFIKGIKLSREIDPMLPILYADELRIKQIIVGLTSLGINYTPKGGSVHITASCYRKDRKKWLKITVKDDGFGLSEQDREKLFSKFNNSAICRRSDGTDLELPAIEKLVQLHKGYCEIKSELQKGTIVTLHFPYLSKEEFETFHTSLQFEDNIVPFPQKLLSQ